MVLAQANVNHGTADVDPGRAGQHAEVIEKSETEPLLHEHVETVTGHAEGLAMAWDERCKKDGVTKWYNPLVGRNARVLFDTPEACQADIDLNYSAQAEAAKLTKTPESHYTPQPFLVTPKRTLEDLMGPQAAAAARAAQSVTGLIQNLGKLAKSLSGREVTAGTLMGMLESQSCLKVGELSDAELQNLLRRATFGGKTRLAKAATAEAKKRKLVVVV